MRYTYLGHSSFLLESDSGTRIVTDPYPQTVFTHPIVDCDVVTVSHHHFDHDDITQVGGSFRVADTPEPLTIGDIRIYGVPSFHDEVMGAKRGDNIIYVFEFDGIRIAHLGDLGHLLTDDQIAAIGQLDLLFIPVGGTYTLDPQKAALVTRQLNAKKTVPMHYGTEGHSFKLKTDKDYYRELEALDRL